MKTWALPLILLLGLAPPTAARASLELGTTSSIALNLERPAWSIGLGLDVHWRVYRDFPSYVIIDSSYFGYRFADATLVVLEPALTTRLFLRTDRELQPYLVTRIQHEIPIVSSESDGLEDEVADMNDSWQVGLGAGMRSDLNARFSIGGEAIAVTRLLSYGRRPTDVSGGVNFLVYLQYRP